MQPMEAGVFVIREGSRGKRCVTGCLWFNVHAEAVWRGQWMWKPQFFPGNIIHYSLISLRQSGNMLECGSVSCQVKREIEDDREKRKSFGGFSFSFIEYSAVVMVSFYFFFADCPPMYCLDRGLCLVERHGPICMWVKHAPALTPTHS